MKVTFNKVTIFISDTLIPLVSIKLNSIYKYNKLYYLVYNFKSKLIAVFALYFLLYVLDENDLMGEIDWYNVLKEFNFECYEKYI